MSGLDGILNLIETQQKQSEESILKAAQSKAEAIIAEGYEKARKAYEDSLEKAKNRAEKDYENSCASVDAAMKRKLLACKIGIINETIEKTISKLDSLPSEEYFDLMIRLITRNLKPEKGELTLCKKDLDRVPDDFMPRLKELAEKKGGSITLSKDTADIENGFILSYGLVSENCSFRAIIEAEKDDIKDTAARLLFG